MTDAELSIVLTGDDAIRKLNRSFRGKDRATDVLSFSQVEGEGPLSPNDPGDPGVGDAPKVLGDVVISLDTAARQAAEIGHDLEHEIARLLVHGILHLLGHDHVGGGTAAREMKREEKRLLRLLGIDDRG